MEYNRIERLILYSLLSSRDWEHVSLYSLASRLDINYPNARRAIHRLEARGLVRLEKPGNRELLISLRGPVGFRPNPIRGSVQTNPRRATRNAQKKGENMNLIDSLRQSLDNQPDYERPQLSDIEKGKIEKMARRLASIKDDRLKMTYYLAVYIENARLLKECNEHRNARGFKPLASMTIPGTNEPG